MLDRDNISEQFKFKKCSWIFNIFSIAEILLIFHFLNIIEGVIINVTERSKKRFVNLCYILPKIHLNFSLLLRINNLLCHLNEFHKHWCNIVGPILLFKINFPLWTINLKLLRLQPSINLRIAEASVVCTGLTPLNIDGDGLLNLTVIITLDFIVHWFVQTAWITAYYFGLDRTC